MRAGFPATTEKSGTSLVTTERAATTQCFPICTPLNISASKPSQQSSPITIGPLLVKG